MKYITYIHNSFKKAKTSTLATQLISSKVAKSFIMVFFIATSYAFSQENYNVECGNDNVLRRNEVTQIDTLKFGCARYLLLQDNSVTYINNVEGFGTLKRGDAGGGVRIDSLGIDRRVGDANPLVIFWGSPEDYEIEILENIDVTYQHQ